MFSDIREFSQLKGGCASDDGRYVGGFTVDVRPLSQA